MYCIRKIKIRKKIPLYFVTFITKKLIFTVISSFSSPFFLLIYSGRESIMSNVIKNVNVICKQIEWEYYCMHYASFYVIMFLNLCFKENDLKHRILLHCPKNFIKISYVILSIDIHWICPSLWEVDWFWESLYLLHFPQVLNCALPASYAENYSLNNLAMTYRPLFSTAAHITCLKAQKASFSQSCKKFAAQNITLSLKKCILFSAFWWMFLSPWHIHRFL